MRKRKERTYIHTCAHTYNHARTHTHTHAWVQEELQAYREAREPSPPSHPDQLHVQVPGTDLNPTSCLPTASPSPSCSGDHGKAPSAFNSAGWSSSPHAVHGTAAGPPADFSSSLATSPSAVHDTIAEPSNDPSSEVPPSRSSVPMATPLAGDAQGGRRPFELVIANKVDACTRPQQVQGV